MFCAESNSKAALSSCQNIPSWNPFHYSLGVDGMIPTVAVEQAPSNSPCLYLEEWPRLPFTARIDRAHSDRARSASKKGTWPLPSHPSEAARSASTFLAVMPLILTPSQVSQPGQSDCGRRTSTVSSCAFREQRDALAARPSLAATPIKSFQFSPFPNSWRDGRGRPKVRASNNIYDPSKLARSLSGDGA
jgi:hypothetical protein